MTRILRAADLFCGAGGSTTGAEASGKVRVVLAVNHWATAIRSHSENHPHARHICARIDDIDPRHDDLPTFELLLASPECTHHSIARGGMPVDDQKRATPWHVCAWAEAKRPKWIVVENVPEFRSWGPIAAGKPIASRKGETFKAWINSLASLGYRVEYQLLNSADFGEATKRTRLFVIARRGTGAIRWPLATHAGRWRAAAEIIDWARHCPSIFVRKRPLADKTLKRIELGLRKFVGPFVVKFRGTSHTSDLGLPLPTITGGGSHEAIAVPFQLKAAGRCPGLTKGIDEPLPTIVAAKPNHSVVMPYLIDVNHGKGPEGRVSSVDKPLGVVTTKRGKSIILPFLTEYYGTGGPRSVDEPITTLTTKPRHGLAIVELLQTMESLGVVDIGFRMLDVDELAAAQGFPRNYVLHGTKADRIKQVGNAVCPGVMRAICDSIALAA